MDEQLITWSRSAWAHCWQVTLLILVVGLIARTFGPKRPHLASVLWLVVLLKCMTPPVWSSPSGVFCWLRGVESSGAMAAPEAQYLTRPAGSEAAANAPEPDAVVVDLRTDAARGGENGRLASSADERKPLSAKFDNHHGSLSIRMVQSAPLLWLFGCVTFATATSLRWWSCWRKLERAGQDDQPQITRALEGLRRQLGVRRKTRLLITRSHVGPAVVGFWRPTIILPAVIVQGKTLAQLEPLLAHELIHIRRGDLWIGLLQTLALGLWWFHPLVRWASQLLTREAERCCDEQVIAHLGCDPAAYARSLLDVLALKTKLQPVPLFPGVRPVDVTSQRLERIMQLRQGCHKRTPLWCWAIMLVFAAVTLPGAALVVRGRERARKSSRPFSGLTEPQQRNFEAALRAAVAPDAASANWRAAADTGGELSIRAFEVGDLVAAIQHQLHETEAAARDWLILIVQASAQGPWEIGERKGFSPAGREQIGKAVLVDDVSKRSLGLTGGTLTVRQTASGLRRVEEQLSILREHGYAQVCVEVRVISGPAAAFSAAGVDWQLIGGTTPASFEDDDHQLVQTAAWNSEAESTTGVSGSVETIVERQLPAMVALIDDAQARKLLNWAQDDSRTNIIMGPKVTVFNGQSARVETGTQIPFVVGVKPKEGDSLEPQIRVVSTGLSIRVHPIVAKNGLVRLDTGLTFRDVRGEENVDFPVGKGKSPITVQVPELSVTRLQSSVTMPLEQMFVICAPAVGSTSQTKHSISVLIKVRKIDESDIVGNKPLTAEQSEAKTEQAFLPAAGGQKLASMGPDDVVAKVDEKVVLYGEITPTVELMLYPHLAKAKTAAEREAIEAQREPLTKSVIQQAVQKKMLLIVFERGMPAEIRSDAKKRSEVEGKIKKSIRNQFDISLNAAREKVANATPEEIAKLMRRNQVIMPLAVLMKERRLQSLHELDAALHEFGTTLEQQVKEFGEYVMGIEAARSAFNKKRPVPEEKLIEFAEVSPAMREEIDARNRREDQRLLLDNIRAGIKVWTIYDE